jgi:hypothetical protein
METKKIPVTESRDKTRAAIWDKLRVNRKRIALVVLSLVLSLLIYGYIHTKHQLEAIKNPSTTGLSQTQQIINTVGKTVALPASETPTLAKVTDVTKLQGNSLFKNAQNGDVVLVYPKSGWTLLYRPSIGKVIEYGQYQTSNGQ